MLPHLTTVSLLPVVITVLNKRQFEHFLKSVHTVISLLWQIANGAGSRESRIIILTKPSAGQFGVQFPAVVNNFSLRQNNQRASGAFPTSYSIGIRGTIPGGNSAETWS